MLTVSLPIEILRTRPRLVFWLAALTQGALWALVPAIVYSAPPGEVADVLAVGREMAFGSELGPPLAFWLAEIALRAAGGHMIGVYLLSQICIVTTYWAVFQLGRSTIGERHALLAVLLMVGISVFTIGSPDFGPDILMMPLWALAILHLWRAVGEAKPMYWFALAADLGLMLLTSYLALLLVILLVAFLLSSDRGRAAASNAAALAAAIVVVFLMLPSFILLDQHGIGFAANFSRLRSFDSVQGNVIAWLQLLALIAVAHAGAGILIVLASNLSRTRGTEAAAITRPPIDPFARSMIYYFALTPLIVVTAFAVITGKSNLSGVSPLLVMSGLAVIVAAGDVIMLYHQRILSIVWFSLLLVPPALVAVGMLLLPSVFAVDLKMAQPANDIAQYFTDNFERRTGRRLEIVGGDPRLATVIALASSRRPRVMSDNQPGRPQLASKQDAQENGAIIVWRATDSVGTPPPPIRAQFPELVPEVPRAFERAVPGRASLLRIGWGLVRPRVAPPATPATTQAQ